MDTVSVLMTSTHQQLHWDIIQSAESTQVPWKWFSIGWVTALRWAPCRPAAAVSGSSSKIISCCGCGYYTRHSAVTQHITYFCQNGASQSYHHDAHDIIHNLGDLCGHPATQHECKLRWCQQHDATSNAWPHRWRYSGSYLYMLSRWRHRRGGWGSADILCVKQSTCDGLVRRPLPH